MTFQATFDSGFGGLPTVQMSGAYTFEVQPPTYVADGNTSAYYMTSLKSASITLNGSVFQTTGGGYMRVDNNIFISGTTYRDGYYALPDFTGNTYLTFPLGVAGLAFEQYGSPPAALTSYALPTSVADLAGFTSYEQDAVLVFNNAALGGGFATYAPVQNLQFVPVPEPGTLAVLVLGLSFLGLRHIRCHR